MAKKFREIEGTEQEWQRQYFVAKAEQGGSLPNPKGVNDGTTFWLKEGAKHIEYLMFDGEWKKKIVDELGQVTLGGTGSLAFGSLYLHEGEVNIDISGAGQGVYVKVTGFTTSYLHEVSVNSNAFNVKNIGVYKVDWQMAGDSQGTGKIYEIDLFLNGVEQHDGSSRRGFGSVGSLGSMSGTAILRVTATDHDIDIRIKEPGSGAGTDIDLFHMNFNIVRIGD